MIGEALAALAAAITTATDLPVIETPGETVAQARAVRLFPPVIDWKEDQPALQGPWTLAKWTLPVVVTAPGTTPAQLRQLYTDTEAVLAAVPNPWRVTAMTPSVATDAGATVPIYTLTLER